MELQETSYQIQGVDLLNVANEFGSPVYVYDADKIVKQYKKLCNAFEGS